MPKPLRERKSFGAGMEYVNEKLDALEKSRQKLIAEGDRRRAREIMKYMDGMIAACNHLGYETKGNFYLKRRKQP